MPFPPKLPESAKAKKKKTLPLKQASDQSPPNLRASVAPSESCSACRNFQSGSCLKYGGYPVEPNLHCDAFESMTGEFTIPADPPMNPLLSTGLTMDAPSLSLGTELGKTASLGALPKLTGTASIKSNQKSNSMPGVSLPSVVNSLPSRQGNAAPAVPTKSPIVQPMQSNTQSSPPLPGTGQPPVPAVPPVQPRTADLQGDWNRGMLMGSMPKVASGGWKPTNGSVGGVAESEVASEGAFPEGLLRGIQAIQEKKGRDAMGWGQDDAGSDGKGWGEEMGKEAGEGTGEVGEGGRCGDQKTLRDAATTPSFFAGLNFPGLSKLAQTPTTGRDISFAAAFVRRCEEQGLTPDETMERIKTAAAIDHEIALEFASLFDEILEKQALNLTPLLKPLMKAAPGLAEDAASKVKLPSPKLSPFGPKMVARNGPPEVPSMRLPPSPPTMPPRTTTSVPANAPTPPPLAPGRVPSATPAGVPAPAPSPASLPRNPLIPRPPAPTPPAPPAPMNAVPYGKWNPNPARPRTGTTLPGPATALPPAPPPPGGWLSRNLTTPIGSVGRAMEGAQPFSYAARQAAKPVQGLANMATNAGLPGVQTAAGATNWALRGAGKGLDVATNLVTGKGALQGMMQGKFLKSPSTLGYSAGMMALPYAGAAARGEQMPDAQNMSAMSLVNNGLAGPRALGHSLGVWNAADPREQGIGGFVGSNVTDLGSALWAAPAAATNRVRREQVGQGLSNLYAGAGDVASDLRYQAKFQGDKSRMLAMQQRLKDIPNEMALAGQTPEQLKALTDEYYAAKAQVDAKEQASLQRQNAQYAALQAKADEVAASGNASPSELALIQKVKARAKPLTTTTLPPVDGTAAAPAAPVPVPGSAIGGALGGMAAAPMTKIPSAPTELDKAQTADQQIPNSGGAEPGGWNPFPQTTDNAGMGWAGLRGQLGATWDAMPDWQKWTTGLGLAAALGGGGAALAGRGGAAAPLAALLGLGAAGYGVTGGDPEKLLQAKFWQQLAGQGDTVKGLELPPVAGEVPPAQAPVAPVAGAPVAGAVVPGLKYDDPGFRTSPQIQQFTKDLTAAGSAGDMAAFRDTAARFFVANPDVAANVQRQLAAGPVNDLKVRMIAGYLQVPESYAKTLVSNISTIDARARQMKGLAAPQPAVPEKISADLTPTLGGIGAALGSAAAGQPSAINLVPRPVVSTPAPASPLPPTGPYGGVPGKIDVGDAGSARPGIFGRDLVPRRGYSTPIERFTLDGGKTGFLQALKKRPVGVIEGPLGDHRRAIIRKPLAADLIGSEPYGGPILQRPVYDRGWFGDLAEPSELRTPPVKPADTSGLASEVKGPPTP